MTSPFAILFLAIQQRLAAITDENSNPIFAFDDQDLGQLENARDNRYPVLWPCVLIDIDDASFQNEGQNVQDAEVSICIRIGFPAYSSTEMHVPATYRNKALYYYDLEQTVIAAFQGWSPGQVMVDATVTPNITADLSDIFGHFIRKRVVKEMRNDLLRVRCLYFTLTMQDYSTAQMPALVSATPTLSVSINIPV